uniref:Uncharacterized protein n=1 Tax=Glossina palpalis gambiensis TaxID=67801 RepID=A0A1B0AL40_9MUSC
CSHTAEKAIPKDGRRFEDNTGVLANNKGDLKNSAITGPVDVPALSERSQSFIVHFLGFGFDANVLVSFPLLLLPDKFPFHHRTFHSINEPRLERYHVLSVQLRYRN